MPYERKTKDIFISDELKNILQEIESESLVAHLLLKKRHAKEDIVEDNVNYISISTQDRGRISYLTQDRMESMSEDEYWNSSRRYHVKPGSFISKVFNGIPPKEVEKFSNLFRSESNKPYFRFKVVSGRAIKDIYHYQSVASESGSLGVSCMKHEHCQKYFDVYTQNSDKVSMLVMLDEDDLVIGRALLWDFDTHKLMDRIYTINDERYSVYFKKWCVKNEYLHKSEQNWYNTMSFEKFGQDRVQLKLELKLDNRHFEYYPYMDTFKFIDDDGVLYNYHPNVRFRTLCSTDGRKQYADYLRFDEYDSVFRYPGDTVWLEYRGFYTHHDNCYYSECNDSYILREDCFYSEEVRDYIFNKENDKFNDKDRIQGRIDYYKEREKERKKLEALKKAKKAAESITMEVNTDQNSEPRQFTFDILNSYISGLSEELTNIYGSDSETFRRFSDRVVRVRRSDNEEEPQQASDSEPMIDEDPSFDII